MSETTPSDAPADPFHDLDGYLALPRLSGLVLSADGSRLVTSVATLDPKLEEAAADLGANPTQTFLRVTLPLAAPGIAAGALLAFSLSFDDYIITNFNASPSSITFPMYVWGASARGVPVQVYVIGTVMFLLALIVVMTGQLISSRRNRQVA